MTSNSPSENPIYLPTYVPISIRSIDTCESPSNRPWRFPYIVITVYPSGDPRSVPSYVPGVNPYIAQSEQQVVALQEERRTTLEQVQSLENIISSGEMKVHEADQLRVLYIIKLKPGIWILDTNKKHFSEENKAHI